MSIKAPTISTAAKTMMTRTATFHHHEDTKAWSPVWCLRIITNNNLKLNSHN